MAIFTPTANASQTLPAEFVHDRIFLTAEAPDHSSLTFYADTGGGWNAIRESVARRLKLVGAGWVAAEGTEFPLVKFPGFLDRAGIPPPSVERWLKGHLVVLPDDRLTEDGFLGSRWFSDHVWDIDYLDASFSIMEEWTPPTDTQNKATLGFRSGPDGTRDLNFPRVAIIVDGETIDVLLDTGATIRLTKASAPEYRLPAGTEVGASYITKSIFDRWVAHHPDWQVIIDADMVIGQASPMIQVPQLTIAGHTSGPVWFTQRPDSAFLDRMSRMMDRPVSGAIGGSGLKYFRLIIDYPHAAAYVWTATSQ